MGKPLLLTEHLRFRMRLRQIPRSLIEEVLARPTARHYDVLTNRAVAVGRTRYAGRERLMIVVYDELPEVIHVITVHPIRQGQHLMRVKRGRWQLQ